jgi:alpha-tubulin suppressor-like RCC1 family protein
MPHDVSPLQQAPRASCPKPRRALLAVLVAAVATLAAAPLPARADTSLPGQLYVFGSNSFGELGSSPDGAPHALPEALALPGASGAPVEMAAGATHSLAITSTGQLYSFGGNRWGQLGRSTALEAPETPSPDPLPTRVFAPGAVGGVVQIAAGQGHSLALSASGQLYSFGDNRQGQLGTPANAGIETPNPTPRLVTLPGTGAHAVQIAAGASFSLVLTSAGQVYSFGSDASGQLGNLAPGPGANPTPALVPLPGATGPAIAIAAGAAHSLVLTSTGQVFAFGSNRSGQLGVATNAGSSTPNPTPLLLDPRGLEGTVVQIAAGAEHSLLLTSTGQLLSFGSNRFGQLGRLANAGSEAPNPAPSPVSLPGAREPLPQISTGSEQSLALTATGGLLAFGENDSGELGTQANLGSSAPNPAPTQPDFPPGTTIDAVQRSAPSAEQTLTLTSDLAVLNGFLPAGQVGRPYAIQAVAAGGGGARTWSAAGLPAGLSIDPSSGEIQGTPLVAGVGNVVLRVSDAFGVEAVGATLALTIAPVPRAFVSSTLTEAQLRANLTMQLGIKGARLRIATLRKRGRYSYGFTALTAGTLAIDWYFLPPGAHLATAKPVLLAGGKLVFANAGTKVITLKLSALGRRLLRRRKSIKLTARGSFTPRGKRTISAGTSFKLAR